MAEVDLERFVGDEATQTLVKAALTLFARPVSVDAEEQLTDMERLMEAWAFIGAMFTEAAPALDTNKKLREGCEEFGKWMAGFARAIREENERTGTPMTARFSGTGVFGMDERGRPIRPENDT